MATSPHRGLSEKWRDFYLKKMRWVLWLFSGQPPAAKILAPQLDQLKRDAGTQKKLCGHRPLLTCSHSDGLQAKCIFSTTAKVSTHVTHHWKDGILVIWALPWSQNHYSNCSQNKQTNQQFKNWGNTHVRHQGCFCVFVKSWMLLQWVESKPSLGSLCAQPSQGS